jgi:hypothetical protein
MGIEPTPPAWKAGALPLSYARDLRSCQRHSCQRHSDPGFGSIRHANVSLCPVRRRHSHAHHSGAQQLHHWLVWPARRLRPNCVARPPPSSDRTARPPSSSESYGSPAVQWGKKDSNLRRLCHQIYSLAPLTAREFPPTTAVTNFQRTDRRPTRYASLNDHKWGPAGAKIA